ncbi:type III secretion system export apparatus subunit SctU [Lacisediminimonas sp.]|uniref:type III secretion system export apparatus subunit SctU n=1 Tax=Lacisediminimonas sp. TaxID=3060582 RepID=UPI002726A3B3|nr:type III secretion system export apparatus subunit SctU [Lacisediminimonas sp.]MDO8301088.1 type III secretion system export apparatus subunit SctU [Lacisediminimonas sp.]
MSSEKTEQPTEHKIRKAREDGQVAKSRDFTQVLLFGALFGYTVANGSEIANNFAVLWIQAGQLAETMPFGTALSLMLTQSMKVVFIQLIPYVLLVIVIGVFGEMIQTGVLFAFKALKPKGDKLNPVTNIKQMFSAKSLVEFIKSNLKVIFLTVLITIVIHDAIGDLLKIPLVGVRGAGLALVEMMEKLIIYTFIGFGAIGLADLIYQRRRHIKDLMMSMEEIKQEYKQLEGDPHMKGHRKEFAREIVMGDDEPPAKTRNATALITNPTHLAVAIRYDEESMPLPIVIAKGGDGTAKRMIAVARACNIPVLQNVPLARALTAKAALDQYIPSELVEPVAEVLLAVRRLARDGGDANRSWRDD